MPFEDIFSDTLSNVVVSEFRWKSKWAFAGLTSGLILGGLIAHFGVEGGSILKAAAIGGGSGYFVGAILRELVFWVLFSLCWASIVTIVFWPFGGTG